MSTPKTWDLVNGFKTCLQVISVAAGYNTNAGTYVTLEPSQIPDTQPALIAVALELVTRPEDPAFRQIGRLVHVLVVGKVPVSQTNAQMTLHQLMDDIERALTDRRDAFPDFTSFPRFVESRVIPPHEGITWIGAEMRYAAHVRLR
jgi:hypothetical protein